MNGNRKADTGFTLLEVTLVVFLTGVIAAFAIPRIRTAMAAYRLNMAARQMVDTLKRAKTQAVADSRRSAVAVDAAGRRIGVVTYDSDGVTVNRIDFIPLPDGVSFERPTGESAPPPGVKTGAALSFPAVGGYHRQNFTTRGFPEVASGPDVVSIFLGNGKDYRAITMSSVGGIRAFRYENKDWVNTRQVQSSGSGDSDDTGDTGDGDKDKGKDKGK